MSMAQTQARLQNAMLWLQDHGYRIYDIEVNTNEPKLVIGERSIISFVHPSWVSAVRVKKETQLFRIGWFFDSDPFFVEEIDGVVLRVSPDARALEKQLKELR